MGNWADAIISKWKSQGVAIGSPASIESIELAETTLNFKFPNDFKQFYGLADGFDNFDMESHMFTIYPLTTIIEEYDRWGDEDFIAFCDFLIASHAIGFKKSEKGIFKLYDTRPDQQLIRVAETFEEIISMINVNSASIY